MTFSPDLSAYMAAHDILDPATRDQQRNDAWTRLARAPYAFQPLYRALADGTMTTVAELDAWFRDYEAQPVAPTRTASIARPLAQDAPDYWHTAALDGDAL